MLIIALFCLLPVLLDNALGIKRGEVVQSVALIDRPIGSRLKVLLHMGVDWVLRLVVSHERSAVHRSCSLLGLTVCVVVAIEAPGLHASCVLPAISELLILRRLRLVLFTGAPASFYLGLIWREVVAWLLKLLRPSILVSVFTLESRIKAALKVRCVIERRDHVTVEYLLALNVGKFLSDKLPVLLIVHLLTVHGPGDKVRLGLISKEHLGILA